MVDPTIKKFCDNMAVQNERSAVTVGYFLQDLENFSTQELKLTPTELVAKLKEGTATVDPKEEQPYIILQQYAAWLKKNRLDTEQNNARTVKNKLSWTRTLFETKFIPISSTLYKKLVKSAKPEDPDLSPVDKKVVRQVITSLPDPRLQSVGMWYASMGWRATESLAMRNLNFEGLNLKTLKFDELPAFVNTSGKAAKTKKGKRRQLTAEMAHQIERLLAWKYRERTINRKINGKWVRVKVKPEPKPEDRLFTVLWTGDNKAMKGKEVKLVNAYNRTAQNVRDAVDRLDIGYEENGKRRKVTLHTLRRYCYTTCNRINGSDYAKYHIGRKVHEYDKRTSEQIAEDFAKVEPFLTLLDTADVEKQQKALQHQLQEEREARQKLEADLEKEKKERAQMYEQLFKEGIIKPKTS